jgi:phosphopentomutase
MKRGASVKNNKRFIWIVLDSVGIGAAPDASRYGKSDEMSHTLKHCAESVEGLKAPNLARLGLGCIDTIPGLSCSGVTGAYGKMREQSHGKDTTNGHWEFVGVVIQQDLPVYPNGFPKEITDLFEAYVGKEVLCNLPASGTTVIEEFGAEHLKTGRPILYTSADSVFQVAAHEDVVPVETLYDWCRYARSILTGKHAVGRVIARPFTGKKGEFVRTHNRKDFSLTFGNTVLNELQNAGITVTGIGKISDIYGGSGITSAIHTHNNRDGMNRVLEQMKIQNDGLIYVNLVDFDSLYGHRNNPVGFARAIEDFDVQLGELMGRALPGDIICITADHGCDPTTPGTDHSREWVPILMWHKGLNEGISLGNRETFADVGATLAEYFGVSNPQNGKSFWPVVARNYSEA